MSNIRKLAIFINADSKNFDIDGVECHHIQSGEDCEDQIDMILLDDMNVKLRFVIIGGIAAQEIAKKYHCTYLGLDNREWMVSFFNE